MPESQALLPTMEVDSELRAPGIVAQIVRFGIPEPTATLHQMAEGYHINMCLTPRPLESRAGYPKRCVAELARLLITRNLAPGDIFGIFYAYDVVDEEQSGMRMMLMNGKLIRNRYYKFITESTAPTPSGGQYGLAASRFSVSATARLRAHTSVSRLVRSGVSTTSSGPRLDALVDSGSYPDPAADGRDWKYRGSGLPSASVKDCPIRLLPTTSPSAVSSEPSALPRSPGNCASSQMPNG